MKIQAWLLFRRGVVSARADRVPFARRFCAFVALLVGVVLATPAHATPIQIDNFEGYTLGQNISGVNGWSQQQSTDLVIVLDPQNPNNQVLSVTTGTNNTRAARNLGTSLAVGDVGTLYMRVMVDSFSDDNRPKDAGFGLSRLASATSLGFGEMASQVRMLDTNDVSSEMDARDGSQFTGSGGSPTPHGQPWNYDPGVWYDLWLVHDNAAQEYSIWIRGGDDYPTQTQLFYLDTNSDPVTSFGFRDTTVADLQSFVITGGGANRGPMYIDNIWYAPGENLAIPEPSTWILAVLGLAGASVVGLRRRRKATG